MKVIYKYCLYPGQKNFLNLPVGSKVLSVAEQDEKPTLWILQDRHSTDNANTQVSFSVIGTGHDITEAISIARYHGSTHGPSGFVWHIFEEVHQGV